MNGRRSRWLALATPAALVWIAGCGGGKTSTAVSIPPTPTESIAITTNTTIKSGVHIPFTETLQETGAKSAVTWSVTSGHLPDGLSLNSSTGTISGTPTTVGFTATTIQAADAGAANVQTFLFFVVDKVSIVGTLNVGYSGRIYSGFLQASGGSSSYSWTLASGTLPPGLILNPSGAISGTPRQVGSYEFTAEVSDLAIPQFVATQAMTMEIRVPPFGLANVQAPTAPIDVPYHSQVSISGGTPPYTLAITSGSLPAGLSLDPASGYIDGTPTQIGTFNFAVTGTDTSQPQQSFTTSDSIQIRAALGRNDSIATATPLGNNPNNNPLASISPYEDPTNATTPNPDTDYYRLIAVAGGVVHVETVAQRAWTRTRLDTVIELLDGNGLRLQGCGAPAYTSSCLNDDINATTTDSALDVQVPGALGTQTTLYLHVFDWRGNARPDMQYYVSVSGVVEPLQIQTTLDPDARRGLTEQQQMTSRGGTGNVTWLVTGGALPAGWTLTSSGVLNGVATTDGTYTFTIQAQDSGNPPQIAHADYTVLIADPVAITSSPTLTNACVNQPYSFTVQTSGGIPPFFFPFSFTSWPAEISFDRRAGIFSGTPSATGTFTGRVGVDDSGQPNSFAEQIVTLSVVNCP